MDDQHESLFFRLPQELRDEVYKYYVYEEQGYFYQAASRKLRLSDGRPIDLALSYSCKRVASELRGLAFEENIITFNTVDGPSPTSAIHFHYIQESCDTTLWDLLSKIGISYFTPDLAAEFARLYPDDPNISRLQVALTRNPKKHRRRIRQFLRRTGLHAHTNRPDNIEVAGSTALERHVLVTLVRLIATNPQFAEWAASTDSRKLHWFLPLLSGFGRRGNWIDKLIRRTPALWHLPSEAELKSARKGFRRYRVNPLEDYRDLRLPIHIPPERLRFSAAAAAIQFLGVVHQKSRAHIRKIIIDEDDYSVSYPQAHVYGLFPFLRENAALRIERHICISMALCSFDHGFPPSKCDIWEELDDSIKKALSLREHIHPGSLSLVFEVNLQRNQALFDAKKYPEKSHQVLDALDEWAAGPVTAPFCGDLRCRGGCFYKDGPTCWAVMEASKYKNVLTKSHDSWQLRVDIPEAPRNVPLTKAQRHHGRMVELLLQEPRGNVF